MPFAPYDYIILYNPYKVNNTDCTFCKIRNDYYIVYNANYGGWVRGTINGTTKMGEVSGGLKVNKVKV